MDIANLEGIQRKEKTGSKFHTKKKIRLLKDGYLLDTPKGLILNE